ncbi:conserved hypothetical protein [Candida albicans WO-1]|uniref:tRNA-splicing endonuclease subunit Sen15 domain-containing protein n=1 Tax=Candida albicans (strain WO-1) TaxID=294748 RepID=C4YEP5_CANAW|nr:conserved hypothetical protein [Candida albicans WO-1]
MTSTTTSTTTKSSPFETSIIDQVRLNLIHYNYWNNVTIHSHEDLEFLSGCPPEPLIPSDNVTATTILKSLNNPNKSEIQTKDNDGVDNIDELSKTETDLDLEWIIPRRLIYNSSQTQDQSKLSVKEINQWFKIIKTTIGYRPKRIIIAIINDDGTIVYYFIHDGITKPRQN